MAVRKTKKADAEFARQYEAAVRRGRRSQQSRAAGVRYCAGTGRIEIELSSGAMFAFPAGLVQGLHGASAADLEDVEIYGAGTTLHWERLDVDYELDALMAGVFGTRTWMRALGRIGGSVTSESKARAARANGLKGGRPKRTG
ncbi:MAG: DUF2442 domain-containing protein [Gemmatimonadota bacterium]